MEKGRPSLSFRQNMGQLMVDVKLGKCGELNGSTSGLESSCLSSSFFLGWPADVADKEKGKDFLPQILRTRFVM